MIVLGLLAARRQWLLLTFLSWQAFMFMLTRQAMPWHALSILPLAGIANWRKPDALNLLLILIWFWIHASAIQNISPLPLSLITLLL